MISVQSLSHVWLFPTPWTAACQSSLSITNSRSLFKLISIELVMTFNHLILCHPLHLPPSIFSNIRVFSNESALCIRWPKYWSFSFNISPSNEYPRLISFRMYWLDLLSVQGTLKSLLQDHSSKHQFFGAQSSWQSNSHIHTCTGKTIALTRWTLVGKVMSLLLNMLSRLLITFLPRSKRLLISWLQSPSAVILEPRKIKSDTVSYIAKVKEFCIFNLKPLSVDFVVVQSLNSVWLCDPMDWSTEGFFVLHYLLEFAQIHVQWIGDAI